jgi:hypothetical protein
MTWHFMKFFRCSVLPERLSLPAAGLLVEKTAKPRLPASLPRYRTARPSSSLTAIGAKCAPSSRTAQHIQPQSHSACDVAEPLSVRGDWSHAPSGCMRTIFPLAPPAGAFTFL